MAGALMSVCVVSVCSCAPLRSSLRAGHRLGGDGLASLPTHRQGLPQGNMQQHHTLLELGLGLTLTPTPTLTLTLTGTTPR